MGVRTPSATGQALERELDGQLSVLLDKGYAELAGLGRDELRARVESLRPLLPKPDATRPIPFVVVVARQLVPPARALGLVERRGATATSVLGDGELERFVPVAGMTVPPAPVYLLADVDTGGDLRNVTPDEALTALEARGRSPLTLEEGIALVTQHPEAVAKGAGFSLLGSRCGDRRVTALWIGDGRPKLGWCWAGNPHTWLGSASCAQRLGTR